MKVLEILARDHSKWCNFVAKNLEANEAIAEDIVQDAYLKVAAMKDPNKFLYGDDQINYWYFIQVLNSIYIDKTRKVGLETIPYEDLSIQYLEVDMEMEEAFERLYNKAIAEINEFGRYGSILSQMYFKTRYSLRDLSSMAEVSLTSIYNSIRSYRQDLRDALGEDWEDFKNQDYDKI